jgi:hypothetical protein
LCNRLENECLRDWFRLQFSFLPMIHQGINVRGEKGTSFVELRLG